MKESRILKVQEASGEKRNIPKIQIQGKWLLSIGYNVGDSIELSISRKRISIKKI